MKIMIYIYIEHEINDKNDIEMEYMKYIWFKWYIPYEIKYEYI